MGKQKEPEPEPRATIAEKLCAQARTLEESPFDFIIVGSGAGGGPLACRLALAGRRVLLIEAGGDPAHAPSVDFPRAQPGEIHDVPGYMAAASEDQEMSWQFSVRHYADDQRQMLDHKYDPAHDSSDKTGGIFYPRSSGLGGCTGHHAMIVVRPNDQDWDDIADLTNDDSWSSARMQPLFAEFENCLYRNEYRGFLPRILDGLFDVWRSIVKFFDPRAVLDEGGHGTAGWQPTSLLSAKLIRRVLKTDPVFTKVLLRSAFAAIEGSKRLTAWLKQIVVTFGVVRAFDPNDNLTRERNPQGGVYLVPIGTGGEGDVKDEAGTSLKGRRAGVREFLLATQRDYPDRLVIVSGVHATQVLFDDGPPPRAIGIRGTRGQHLYRASPLSSANVPLEPHVDYFTQGEVILCGGTFNTPQLLMLSGIGDQTELKSHKIKCRVHLPGVGKNLQDRYEVGLVSELKGDLNILDDVCFQPGDPNDPERKLWLEKKEGLYASNGGTLVVLQRSRQSDGAVPDLFTFGAPAAFRGYYWNWSRELFRPTKGAPADQRNLWTWVILKAYSRNNGGTVQLRSSHPFDTPRICFHSFDEGATPDWQKDLDALVEAVESMRRINRARHSLFGDEIQPAGYLATKNSQRANQGLPAWTLADWIKNEAWGHHACGTCRIGSDAWQPDPSNLNDKRAVLDSRFRVHGVVGLRVVDASIFPRIPGYFILAPIFMVSEKAASTILDDTNNRNYPGSIRRIEEDAVRKRRGAALLPANLHDQTGLALSGGGIRSAVFNLGVLQALAQKDKLRKIDYLSTVSGGSFIGGFLGRLFMRNRVVKSSDPCGRIQDVLRSNQSAPIRWLRDNSNYLFATGSGDRAYAIGIFFRNILSVHLVVGIFLLALFGALKGISRVPLIADLLPRFSEVPGSAYLVPPGSMVAKYLSDWWWLPFAALVLVVLPMSLAFWLAPKEGSNRPHPPYGLAAWLLLILAACLAFGWTSKDVIVGGLLVTLVMAWIWQEIARRRIPAGTPREQRYAGDLIRNRLTRGLGESLVILLVLIVWVLIDSLANATLSLAPLSRLFRWLMAAAPFLLMLHSWAEKLLKRQVGIAGSVVIRALAVVIALALLVFVDTLAHKLFGIPVRWAWVCVTLAFVFSAVVGRAFDFVNYSSLHAAYAARITRCFLGATNDARYEDCNRILTDVQISHADDDVPQHLYRPEEHGGPLHLLSVCINDTVEHASQRALPEREGTLMTIGSFGVSVGQRYFARWTNNIVPPSWLRLRRWIDGLETSDAEAPALDAIPIDSDPNTFHPLGRRDHQSAVVEGLSLGNWIA
ncbi:MAG: GMC family oxidoreductase N-terminal domain-containing protein, partial [Planctomycetia bacterium]|nr:GMC family oxidoreductase N-terminal domain-containing protein [Planctomycetia bacterium]